MASNGLFTQGLSVDDLLAKRSQRSQEQQRQMADYAAQGARDPQRARMGSMFGSIIGRALGDNSGGGDAEMDRLKATNAAQSEAQQGFLAAQGSEQSALMYEQAKTLAKTYPAASAKMLVLAKAAKKEEAATAAAAAQATKDAEDAKREQDLAAQKIVDAKAALDYKYATEDRVRAENIMETKRKEGVTEAVAQRAVKADALRNKKTVQTAEVWNAANNGALPEGTLWLTSTNGEMRQLAKEGSDPLASLQIEGMELIRDKKTGRPVKYVPIPNGPQWLAAQVALAEADTDAERAIKTANNKELATNTVVTQIDKALDIASLDSWTTPIFGRANTGKMAGYFEASERSNLEAAMTPVLAEAAFGTLKEIREESKTGGALGAINTVELEMLKNKRAALQLSQGKEEFIANLTEYRTMFLDAQHGTRAAIEAHNKLKPNAEPLVYWQDTMAAEAAIAEAQAAANAPEQTGFGSGAGPNAATMPASVAKYYQKR